LAHHQVRHALFGCIGNLGTFHQRHDNGGVHVERQRGGRAALAERFVGDCVVEETGTGAAPGGGDGQVQKAILAEPLVILGGVRRVAVVLAGADGEPGREGQAALLQALLFLTESEIHALALRLAWQIMLAGG
jgi:hypothetical protein